MPNFLESAVAEVLQKVLGAFVHGIDADRLQLSVWNGDVRLDALTLRTDVIDALPLPVRVVAGSVGEVRVTVPSGRWSRRPSATRRRPRDRAGAAFNN